jgi:hypothetical protein
VTTESEERGDRISRNGTVGLARGGTKTGLLGDTGGGFLSGILAFSLGLLGVGLLARTGSNSRRDTGWSGKGGRGVGCRVQNMETPVVLRGHEPIAECDVTQSGGEVALEAGVGRFGGEMNGDEAAEERGQRLDEDGVPS